MSFVVQTARLLRVAIPAGCLEGHTLVLDETAGEQLCQALAAALGMETRSAWAVSLERTRGSIGTVQVGDNVVAADFGVSPLGASAAAMPKPLRPSPAIPPRPQSSLTADMVNFLAAHPTQTVAQIAEGTGQKPGSVAPRLSQRPDLFVRAGWTSDERWAKLLWSTTADAVEKLGEGMEKPSEKTQEKPKKAAAEIATEIATEITAAPSARPVTDPTRRRNDLTPFAEKMRAHLLKHGPQFVHDMRKAIGGANGDYSKMFARYPEHFEIVRVEKRQPHSRVPANVWAAVSADVVSAGSSSVAGSVAPAVVSVSVSAPSKRAIPKPKLTALARDEIRDKIVARLRKAGPAYADVIAFDLQLPLATVQTSLNANEGDCVARTGVVVHAERGATPRVQWTAVDLAG